MKIVPWAVSSTPEWCQGFCAAQVRQEAAQGLQGPGRSPRQHKTARSDPRTAVVRESVSPTLWSVRYATNARSCSGTLLLGESFGKPCMQCEEVTQFQHWLYHRIQQYELVLIPAVELRCVSIRRRLREVLLGKYDRRTSILSDKDNSTIRRLR